MEPKIYSREDLLIAGVGGNGDRTGEAWETFRKMDNSNPLRNNVSNDGYEVRIYPGTGPGDVHVGLQVKNTDVPEGYEVLSLPASLYAEFEIHPAEGYTSGNDEMNQWLRENAGVYEEGKLGGSSYVVEIYDKRYKGDKDPSSIVGILVPVVKTSARD